MNTLVGHHFTRTLVKVALDHVEQVGSDEERRAVWEPHRARRAADTAPDRTPRSTGDGSMTGAPDRRRRLGRPSPSRRPPGPARPTCPPGRSKTELVRAMFDAIAPRYDLVNRTMTFGLDVRWRKQSLRALGLPAGSTGARPGLWHR